MLAWSVRSVLSGRGRFICSIVSVSGSDFRCREGGFRASSAACFGNRSRPISCVSVRSCSSRSAFSSRCGESVVGPFLVPFVSSGRRCGWEVACLPVIVETAAWACDAVHLVPFSLLVCSLWGAGRRGAGSSISSCLLSGGDGVDVRHPVPVPVARAIACPLSVGEGGRMR